MFRNYLKSAWRNLITHRLFSSINIIGLGLSLAACMLIMLYVQHENSYDSFHKKSDRIVWIHGTMKWGNVMQDMSLMSYATAPLSQQYIPNIEATVRIYGQYDAPVIQSYSNSTLKFAEKDFLFADSNFLDIFSFKLSQGNPMKALNSPFSILITSEIAKKYFGEENPIGQKLSYKSKYVFTVTGLIENPPSNSSIKYKFVASMASFPQMDELKYDVKNSYVQGGTFATYFLMKDASKNGALEKDLSSLQTRMNPDQKTPDLFIATPLRQMHLSASYAHESNVKYLSLFPMVAGLILLLALTNYISLSTARASLRAKEIGVRKVMGANRKAIAFQFFLESALFTSTSFVLGYVLCFVFQREFFQYLQLPIDHNFLISPRIILSFSALFLFTVLLVSVYPSILLSAYNPVMVLYGKFNRLSGGLSLRKFITVFQFSISIVLIICGIVINRQVYFFRNTYTGLNRENVVTIPFPESMGKNYPSFRSEIASLAGVQQVAVDHYKMYAGSDNWIAKSEQNQKGSSIDIFNVDNQFIHLLELQWLVPPDDPAYENKEHQIVLNETTVSALNLKPGILHQQIVLGNDVKLEVAGIVKDFNYRSLDTKISPMGLMVRKDTSSLWTEMNGSLFAKINAHVNLPVLMNKMKVVYEKYDQTTPFSYSFMDDDFEAMYKAEERLSQIFFVFIMITVGIASLGLFGLVTFMTSQRLKEIGIRKVLGASVSQIVNMLAKDFVKLVILAWLISCPVAWIFMGKWLDSFAYRIHLEWWMPAGAALIAILIAVGTIGAQSFRAAAENPVKSLRSE